MSHLRAMFRYRAVMLNMSPCGEHSITYKWLSRTRSSVLERTLAEALMRVLRPMALRLCRDAFDEQEKTGRARSVDCDAAVCTGGP